MSLALAALALAGCGGKKDAGGTGAGSAVAAGEPARDAGAVASGSGTGSASAGSAAAGSGDAGSADDAPVVSTLDPAAAQALVEAWLAAQNGGDFAAYSALYAEKFAGIKRVGARTWIFDRAGWMKDRQRMFKAPMKVAVKDITITGSAAAASVMFVQTYTQGRFRDEGPKSLVVVKTPGGYQIAREEMLHSAHSPAPTTTGLTPYLVHTIDNVTRFFVDEVSDEAGRGALGKVHQEDSYLYVVADASKTADGKAWQGRVIKVLDASGAFCEVPVTQVDLVSGGYPHFGVFEEWKGDPAAEPPTKPATEREKSAHIWAMRLPYLTVAVATSACRAPVLAIPVAATLHPFPRVAASTEHHDLALAAFRTLEEWQGLQKEFVTDHDGQGTWDPDAKSVTFSDGMRTFVVVHTQAGHGCGEFFGSLAAVFEIKGQKAVLLGTREDFEPTMIVGVEGETGVHVVGESAGWDIPAGIFEFGAAPQHDLAEPLTFPVHDGC